MKDKRKSIDESINAENKKQTRQKPPLSLNRIAAEILAGIGMSFVVMMLDGCIGSIILFGGIGGEASNRITFTAIFAKFTPAVYGIAGAVGVYLLGSRGDQTGSLLLTLAFGFFAGLLKLAVLPLAKLLPGILRVILFFSSVPLLLFVPPIFATLGFNLTRRYKENVLPRSSGE